MNKKLAIMAIVFPSLIMGLFVWNGLKPLGAPVVLKKEEKVVEEVVKEEKKAIRTAVLPPSWKERYDKIVVQAGETIETIAQNRACFKEQLMEINLLQSDKLETGQALFVPKRKEPVEKKVYYTVKKGDSPWIIARNNGIELDELLNLNSLNADKAKRLKPGDILQIK